MSKHYDTLETRTPAEREKALMQALPQQSPTPRPMRRSSRNG